MRGPSEHTLIQFPLPRRLPALSYCDEGLLRRWLDLPATKVDELHVNVPLGPEPLAPSDGCDEATYAAFSYSHAYKLDAAVLLGGKWTLVECKPRARHKALGQILSYGFWWQVVNGLGLPGRLIVVTTDIMPEVRAVYERFGVGVVEVGDVAGAGDRFY